MTKVKIKIEGNSIKKRQNLLAIIRKEFKEIHNTFAVLRTEELAAHVLAVVYDALGREVPTGVFGAHMEVALVNDGPVTLLLEREAAG